MKTYTQLSQEERYYISSQRAKKVSFCQIARDLDRSKSTITREYKRNLRPSGYYAAFKAHSYAVARRRRSRRKSHFPPDCWKLIFSLLEEKLSPEQIADKLTTISPYSISYQTIYRIIRIDRRRGGFLFTHCRVIPKRRRKRYGSIDFRGILQGKRLISERPQYINDRSEFGHWEGDTVMGNDRYQCLLTLVERKSGLNRIVKLKSRTAKNVIKALISLISSEPRIFKSLTFDNGSEFHSYKILEDMFGIVCYFANPHHPWERGTNENFNGLVRQYFPKGSSLSYIGNQKTQFVSNQLNDRPRKRYSFKSPKEVFYGYY